MNGLAIVLCIALVADLVQGSYIKLVYDTPIVQNGTLKIEGILMDGSNPSERAKYQVKVFMDRNDDPIKIVSIEPNQEPKFSVTVEASKANGFLKGNNNLSIYWYKYYVVQIIPIEVAESHFVVNVTELLNGNLELSQNGTFREADYVSADLPVTHTVAVNGSDLGVFQSAAYYEVFWFVDCEYKGKTSELTFTYDYTEENRSYNVEALLVASTEPLPEPTTTTTTTTTTTPATTTTTSTTTSTTKPTTTTTPAPTTSTTSSTTPKTSTSPTTKKSVAKRSAPETPVVSPEFQAEVKNLLNISNKGAQGSSLIMTAGPSSLMEEPQPYVCFSKYNVSIDPKKFYGLFTRQVIPKHPIQNVSVAGNTWIQPGESSHITFKCEGNPSPPFQYCIEYVKGVHNISDNDTCSGPYSKIDLCQFTFSRFVFDQISHTIVFFIKNDITNKVSKSVINVYEAKTHSPLSVIVVPVSCVLFAVTMIIFGIAYYIQNRNRHLVEVADFNFGETQSLDMEYKTFRQRLLDSFRETMSSLRPNRSGDGDDVGGGGESSNLRYGVMS